MEPLSKALKDSVNIATEQAKKTQTPSDGFGTKDLSALTKLAQSRRGNMADLEKIQAMTRTKLYPSLWEINADTDSTKRNEAAEFIRECLTPITFDEAVNLILRMLAHFPQRQTFRDAIIASDTAGDLARMKLGVVAVSKICDDLRRESSNENPWPPVSGEIIRRAKNETELLQRMLERITAAPVRAIEGPKKRIEPTKTWDYLTFTKGQKWEHWPEDVRSDFVAYHKEWDRSTFRHVGKLYGITVETFNEEVEKRQKSAVDVTV